MYREQTAHYHFEMCESLFVYIAYIYIALGRIKIIIIEIVSFEFSITNCGWHECISHLPHWEIYTGHKNVRQRSVAYRAFRHIRTARVQRRPLHCAPSNFHKAASRDAYLRIKSSAQSRSLLLSMNLGSSREWDPPSSLSAWRRPVTISRARAPTHADYTRSPIFIRASRIIDRPAIYESRYIYTLVQKHQELESVRRLFMPFSAASIFCTYHFTPRSYQLEVDFMKRFTLPSGIIDWRGRESRRREMARLFWSLSSAFLFDLEREFDFLDCQSVQLLLKTSWAYIDHQTSIMSHISIPWIIDRFTLLHNIVHLRYDCNVKMSNDNILIRSHCFRIDGRIVFDFYLGILD